MTHILRDGARVDLGKAASLSLNPHQVRFPTETTMVDKRQTTSDDTHVLSDGGARVDLCTRGLDLLLDAGRIGLLRLQELLHLALQHVARRQRVPVLAVLAVGAGPEPAGSK